MHPKTIQMLDRHDSTDDAHNRVLRVWTDDDAFMTVPTAYWMEHMAGGYLENTSPSCASDRSLAASVCASFRYLIMNCTKEEAWRRIKMLREAIENEPTDSA